jgi:hypothetical protein
MAEAVIADLARFLAGEPVRHGVSAEAAARMTQ